MILNSETERIANLYSILSKLIEIKENYFTYNILDYMKQ